MCKPGSESLLGEFRWEKIGDWELMAQRLPPWRGPGHPRTPGPLKWAFFPTERHSLDLVKAFEKSLENRSPDRGVLPTSYLRTFPPGDQCSLLAALF